jgi:hypothetical protein
MRIGVIVGIGLALIVLWGTSAAAHSRFFFGFSFGVPVVRAHLLIVTPPVVLAPPVVVAPPVFVPKAVIVPRPGWGLGHWVWTPLGWQWAPGGGIDP